LRRFVKIYILIAVLLISFTSLSPYAHAEAPTVRVLLLGNQYAVRIKSAGNLSVKDAYSLDKITNIPNNVVVKVYKGKIFVNKKETKSKFVYIVPKNMRGVTYLNGVGYRGYYLVGFNKRGRLQVINCIHLEDYMAGVLGGEIHSSWPIAAIKAQAVAARTYVLFKMQKSKNRLHDVVNDTGDQMYIGVRGESSRFTRAIRATKLQVMARDGKTICAYYHSNCGGGTSDSWNVFQKDYGFLAAAKCPFCANAPNSKWGKTLYVDTIRHRLNRNGHKIGRIISIKPYSRDKAGRVIYLEVKHTWGATYVFASEFRRIMGYRTIKSAKFTMYPKKYITYRYTKRIASNRSGMALASNMTGMTGGPQTVAENVQVPTYYYFSGKGWGHGVGMCQWGARGMALSGYKYRQILKQYYPGTSIYVIEEE